MFSRQLLAFASLVLPLGCCASPGAKPPAATTLVAPAPVTRPTRVISPEISADRTVTFRLAATRASEVELWGDWPKPNGGPLKRDAAGVWSGTFGPLPAGLWAYQFKVDGMYMADPSNTAVKPSRTVNTSVLSLPGGGPWDREAGVARGTLHVHDYVSKSLQSERRLRVYTPAGYEARAGETFPVLYLLHGSGDNESTWSEFGKAHVILDNLIAAGKVRPMIVVMTDGHALSAMDPAARSKNVEAFSADFLNDVMPLVESAYRVREEKSGRAIAGLSMGGNQALIIGLRRGDLFKYVAGMSSAIRQPETDLGSAVPSSETSSQVIWTTCGTEDFLLKENRAFDQFLTDRKVAHSYLEIPGGHTWPFWRAALVTVLPTLFTE